jgi:hypothetical protein
MSQNATAFDWSWREILRCPLASTRLHREEVVLLFLIRGLRRKEGRTKVQSFDLPRKDTWVCEFAGLDRLQKWCL